MRPWLRVAAVVAAFAGMTFGASTESAASRFCAQSRPDICSGGDGAPGTYHSMQVTGICTIPDETVTPHGGLVIERTAALFALSHTSTPLRRGWAGGGQCPFFVVVGCTADSGCATPTHDHIDDDVQADEPLAIMLHGDTIPGGVPIEGGSGGVNCDPNPHCCKTARRSPTVKTAVSSVTSRSPRCSPAGLASFATVHRAASPCATTRWPILMRGRLSPLRSGVPWPASRTLHPLKSVLPNAPQCRPRPQARRVREPLAAPNASNEFGESACAGLRPFSRPHAPADA
jgi:hypothetical protein